jgi:predicted  nucleic acid-binding Zn-ribbon protein
MAEEIKKVIEIKVKGERTVQDLKNNIKELQNALVNLDTGTEDYDKVVKQLTLDQAKLSEVMNAGKATVAGAAGSYNALKKEMADLKKV